METHTPSFSSTLLDAIYRSIDEQESVLTTRKKHTKSDREMDDLRRACLIEKWMIKRADEKPVAGRRSAADFDRSLLRRERDFLRFYSSSSSSDSSSGGGFSSSEAESVYGAPVRPKPFRTGADQNYGQSHKPYKSQPNPKHEGKLVKTKLRALKIYGDLKKVRQPISPGGRLSTFLNSIFTAGNTKKPKTSSSSSSSSGGGDGYNEAAAARAPQLDRKSKSANASTCSSASSFSRSCLSKTPSSSSSRGKLGSGGGAKRSVRFFPVSVIVGEDCQPCGEKSLCGDGSRFMSTGDDELKVHLKEKNRHVEEVERNLLHSYPKKVECEFDSIDIDYEDDDSASCGSSDLFELDNLSVFGMERYEEELPVYETTQMASLCHRRK